MLRDVIIASGCRTPIGSFGGKLKDVPSSQLGVIAAKEAIRRAGVTPDVFDDCLVGNCMMRSDEINVARVISLRAGLPFTVPAATIQRQCSSSMQALVFAAQQIWCGDHEAVLVGGVEAMSRVPYAVYDMRWGKRMWDGKVTDQLMEGLTDPIGGFLMGVTAENLAAKHGITRAEQDELALTSQTRACAAIKSGRLKDEIVPVEIPQKKGAPVVIDTDEHPRFDASLDSLAKLPAAFKKENGTVTAGNASGINDAAAFAVVMSGEKAKALGVKPLARIVSHAVAGVEPELMGYGPVPAIKKALAKAKLDLKDIGLFEINEAFAAQYLACEKMLGLDRSIVNVNGSGIALGHPVGATGIRIVISLIYEMKRRGVKLGCASLCVGGGMGKAVIVESID
jgi:acetyl-CoA C-acetyltransferase